jgi:hypothetical protein
VLPLHHQGRDRGPLAATTVRGLMSALSQNFKACGCDRQWDDAVCSGNLVQSSLVQSAIEAYARMLVSQGVRERRAVPMLADKLVRLVRAVDRDCTLFRTLGKRQCE